MDIKKYQEKKETMLYQLYENVVDENGMIPIEDVVAIGLFFKNAAQCVFEFHKYFNHPVGKSPYDLVDAKRALIRIKWISSELQEATNKGINKNNIVEIIDGLLDAEYFLIGTLVEYGVHDKYSELFSEVHKSNMSKLCKTKEEALETQEAYRIGKHPDKKGIQIETYISFNEPYYIVYRTSDNKVLKSINYRPPNLKDIIFDEPF